MGGVHCSAHVLTLFHTSGTAGGIALKFAVVRDPLAACFSEVEGRVHLDVRTRIHHLGNQWTHRAEIRIFSDPLTMFFYIVHGKRTRICARATMYP